MNTCQVSVGQRVSLSVTITAQLIDSFAALSGDDNPLHMDDAAAKRYGFPRRVSHGVLSLALVSRLIGKELPGAGAFWRSLKVEWLRPVFPDDTLRVEGEVVQVSTSAASVALAITGHNQHGTLVLRGEAQIGCGEELERTAPSADPKRAPEPSSLPPLPVVGQPAVIVTGGSGGIGRAIAIDLGRAGYPVAVAYHTGRDHALSVVTEIEASGGQAVALPLDLCRTVDRREIHAAGERLGPLLGLVHAATPPLQNVPFERLSLSDFERYYRIYVGGAIELVQALLEDMKRHRFGRVTLLGTSAISGAPPAKMAAYVTAKSAIWGLCKSLATELGPYGVTVNMISPGLTMTDLTRDYSPRMQLAEAQKTPMRRLALPSDSASLVRFLMSEQASFITGVNLPLTGGLVIS